MVTQHHTNLSMATQTCLQVLRARVCVSFLLAVQMVVLLAIVGCGSGGGGGEKSSAQPTEPPVLPPVADFSATPTTGSVPLVVQFHDTSVGNIQTWAWSFGDGTTSTDPNPKHTYTVPGNATVSLTVNTAKSSDNVIKSSFVMANAPPAPPPAVPPPPAPPSGPAPAAPSPQPVVPPTPVLTPPLVPVSAPTPPSPSMAPAPVLPAPTPPPTVVAPAPVLPASTPPPTVVAPVPMPPVTPPPPTVVAPTSAQIGQWAAPIPWPIVAVNAALLPTGEVLSWDGTDHGYDARLWDPTTGLFTEVPNHRTNMFCSGLCALSDGRIVVTGGHAVPSGHVGLLDTNLFDPVRQTWAAGGNMHTPRWYPTPITLPDGRILVTGGEINCARCAALIPETYDPRTNTWTPLTKASREFPYYPHMFVLPDGRVLAAATAEDPIQSQVLDMVTQTWAVVDANMVDGGSSVMVLPGKIMKSGTSTDPDMPVFNSAATTYVLDMNEPTPKWRQTSSMAHPRTFHNLTLLPDGTVLATGGGITTDRGDLPGAVHTAELWSPTTEAWTPMARMQIPRLYHSTALLMPDGRVLTVGGGRFNGDASDPNQFSAEIYSPPYLFQGPRPTISAAPTATTYGTSFAVLTPDAGQIATVSLLRLGTVTHAFNTGQRFVPLTFTAVPGTLTVQAPANGNLAPPGYYLLFLLDQRGVPSIGAMVHVQ